MYLTSFFIQYCTSQGQYVILCTYNNLKLISSTRFDVYSSSSLTKIRRRHDIDKMYN